MLPSALQLSSGQRGSGGSGEWAWGPTNQVWVGSVGFGVLILILGLELDS